MQFNKRQVTIVGSIIVTLMIGYFVVRKTSKQPFATGDQTVTYTQPLTITGLPAGCTTAISGTVITVTGCTAPPAVTVTTTCTATVIQIAQQVQCTAAVANTTNTAVTWTSSNTSIATVNSSGQVTGVAPGTSNITAVSQADSSKSGSVGMTVAALASIITQDATSPLPISSGQVTVSGTQDPPITGVGTNKLTFATANQNFEFSVSAPVAGNYTIAARLCTDATTTGGALTVHFEMPAGTRISTPLTVNSPTQWITVSSTQTVALAVGINKVRLVVDSLPTGGNTDGYIHWFQLTPTGSAAQHSVTLKWQQGAVTNPPCVFDVCPGPANCFGQPTDFRIYRTQTSGSYPTQYYTSVNAMNLTFTDQSVLSGQTYYYRVTAYNANACTPESAPTSEVKAVIPATLKRARK